MNEIFKTIDKYYSEKITSHGVSPEGVDWNNEASQNLRFEQLLKIIETDKFSLADLGCGYGKLFDIIKDKYKDASYYGYDLSSEMINLAKDRHQDRANNTFIQICSLDEVKEVDYIVASGIFNVKLDHSDTRWFSYIMSTIDIMNQKSKKGFAFNILTKYSDVEYMKDNLYYADPMFLFDYCKTNFSNNVAVLHDYKLYEFTILVRKG